jgi:phosphoribosylformimino-5-aminoimidazole carboxamide ribotide isomerase
MRIVPVLDLMAGRAVHAVGGNRDHYGPLKSVLHEGTDPIELARALVASGHREVYVADLDAIAGSPINSDLLREMGALGLSLWVDAGLRMADDAVVLDMAGRESIVAGLETLSGPNVLGALVERFGPGRVVFSLDLRGGRPMTDTTGTWGHAAPGALAAVALDLGVRRILLLDLAHVGGRAGPVCLDMLSALRKALPDNVELSTGGGVANLEDVRRLHEAGASAVLVGSAIHDGRIRPIARAEYNGPSGTQ